MLSRSLRHDGEQLLQDGSSPRSRKSTKVAYLTSTITYGLERRPGDARVLLSQSIKDMKIGSSFSLDRCCRCQRTSGAHYFFVVAKKIVAGDTNIKNFRKKPATMAKISKQEVSRTRCWKGVGIMLTLRNIPF